MVSKYFMNNFSNNISQLAEVASFLSLNPTAPWHPPVHHPVHARQCCHDDHPAEATRSSCRPWHSPRKCWLIILNCSLTIWKFKLPRLGIQLHWAIIAMFTRTCWLQFISIIQSLDWQSPIPIRNLRWASTNTAILSRRLVTCQDK